MRWDERRKKRRKLEVWQNCDRFLAVNVPLILELMCYVCIVSSGGKHYLQNFE